MAPGGRETVPARAGARQHARRKKAAQRKAACRGEDGGEADAKASVHVEDTLYEKYPAADARDPRDGRRGRTAEGFVVNHEYATIGSVIVARLSM